MADIRQRRGLSADKPTDSDGQEEVRAHDVTSNVLPVLAVLLCLSLVAWLLIKLFLPCPIEPESFTLPERRPFKGALAPNDKLQFMSKLAPGKFRGPESMAIHDGKMYTGVADGRIIEINLQTEQVRTLVDTLGTPPCGQIANEENCGRPLGVRYSNGFLFVIDAYLGLFKINVKTKHVQNLFPGSYIFPDGIVAMFLNDVEISRDGLVYVTDTSSRWRRSDHLYAGLESRPDGRLIVYNPKTNETKILLRGLYAANGLQLTPNEDAILITEMARNRVTKFNLSGRKAGTSELFTDNLPGIPDNIRPSSSGGYWVALAVARHPDIWSTWDFLAPRAWLKRLMARMLARDTIGRMMPAYSLVVELDSAGNIINSLHDPTGKTMPLISEVLDDNGVLYFGSFFLPFLGKIDPHSAS